MSTSPEWSRSICAITTAKPASSSRLPIRHSTCRDSAPVYIIYIYARMPATRVPTFTVSVSKLRARNFRGNFVQKLGFFTRDKDICAVV
jgi:hypothetical protein